MKQLLITSTLCLFSSLVWAGEQIDRTLEAAASGYVEIEHVNGYATIRGWDKNQVQVKGELGDKTDEFIFERDGNEVVIKVEVEKRRGSWTNWGNDDGDKLEIFVPIGSRVSYTSTNADVEVKDINGGASIETVNGEIDVSALQGRVRLEAVNGDINATDLAGDVKIETVNGDIKDRNTRATDVTYESVNGDIDVQAEVEEFRAETVNGDMELNLGTVKLLNVNTVNGSIETQMTLARKADVRATSVGGKIELGFRGDVSAHFDIEAHAGGSISNGLSDDRENKAKYGPGRWLEFSVGGGDGKVDVSTVSGRIKLVRL
ncbi:DUF4097 family beta strand repeat-containing protein [Aestuariibacter halophilus]|uniref:DUF4097 family beta strand repeat-containing protein n=1 Tax=Fluctibacter halophilus TaxID=226011 RepID=A0ABS8GB12_9ALTE|nr:DUF4097 family beta strand repeat-containing protein [Aestuariibacter halophilus]MCC2617693.1 DUF4097 family beta strand repeat-containing protein [Aestuariibacter halophilus]